MENEKTEKLKNKLNAVACNEVNGIYNISYGTHAERKTEAEADEILNEKTEAIEAPESVTEKVTESVPVAKPKAKAKKKPKAKAKKPTKTRFGKNL